MYFASIQEAIGHIGPLETLPKEEHRETRKAVYGRTYTEIVFDKVDMKTLWF